MKIVINCQNGYRGEWLKFVYLGFYVVVPTAAKHTTIICKLWKICLDRDFTLPNIQNYGWSNSDTIQWVEVVFPENYHDCLNMDVEEITYSSDTETDFENDDDNI